MEHPYLTVIVPCYNERENLVAGVLEEMDAYLSRQPYTYEVLISDDGSTDDSRDIVRSRIGMLAGFRLLENAHGGKPMAVWAGIQSAGGDLVLFTDMDQSTPIDQVARLLPLFDQGCDVVIGSRGMSRANFPFYRRLGSSIFFQFRRLLLLRTVSDTQCGFKAMRRSAAERLFPLLEAIRRPADVKGWKVTAFDVELLFLAERSGYRLGEVVVEWSNRDRAQGKGKSYLGESREMATQVLRVKLNALRGFYNQLDEQA